MTDEQKAAAARLRRMSADDYGHQVGLRLLQDDRLTLVAAYLAEHAADDDEPVTSGWLVSMGFRTGGGACWIRGEGPQIAIRYYEDLHGGGLFITSSVGGPPILIVGGDAVKWSGTRGEVRRLCAALAVPLQENSPTVSE